jgi:UDP-glucose 4-epimerase
MLNPIIVFGAAGFVGRHLVSALSTQGFPVTALVRKGDCDFPKGVKVLKGEFDTPESFVPFLEDGSVFFHVASSTTPANSAGKPLYELETNIKPSLSILAALQNKPTCRLIYISSGGTVYGNSSDKGFTETAQLKPHSYYGAGKVAVESFINAAVEHERVTAIILRPSNLYGPGQTMKTGFGIIPAIFNSIVDQKEFKIWGNGSAVRDYLYIDDFIDLAIRSIDAFRENKLDIYNASHGEGTSITELTEITKKIIGTNFDIVYDLNRSTDLSNIVIDSTKARKRLSWEPKISLEEGLRRTWEWWIKGE